MRGALFPSFSISLSISLSLGKIYPGAFRAWHISIDRLERDGMGWDGMGYGMARLEYSPFFFFLFSKAEALLMGARFYLVFL